MYLNGTDMTALLVMIYLFLLFAFVMTNCVLSFFALNDPSCPPPHMLMPLRTLQRGRAALEHRRFSLVAQLFTTYAVQSLMIRHQR